MPPGQKLKNNLSNTSIYLKLPIITRIRHLPGNDVISHFLLDYHENQILRKYKMLYIVQVHVRN